MPPPSHVPLHLTTGAVLSRQVPIPGPRLCLKHCTSGQAVGLLRRTGNCPPPSRKELMAQPNNSSARGTASRRAGQQVRHVRVMSWNAGHLGQQLAGSRCRPAMFLSSRKRTGRSPLSSGFQDGTASPRPRPQHPTSSLRLLTRGASLIGTLRTDHQPLERMES